MKRTRYEILLPLRYNDGRPIEPVKFDQTSGKVRSRYNRRDSSRRQEIRGTLYEDLLLRLFIDVPASEPADEFFGNCKEVLKARFEQIDSQISSHEIEIL